MRTGFPIRSAFLHDSNEANQCLAPSSYVTKPNVVDQVRIFADG